jgi:hypothetical protein
MLLLLAALSLAACASRNEPPPYAAVAPADYVYCRKDRDAARNAAVNRADRKQRDLAEYMMNHPDHP